MSTASGTNVDLRYPIGKFQPPESYSEQGRAVFIQQIEDTPARLREAVNGLSDAQLNTPYRPDGWTVRQLVHHLADSHMNSYIRCKLALTQQEPTINSYDENQWANFPDGKSAPPELSLSLLDSLHRRWVETMRSLTPEQWSRKFRHPERGAMTLDTTVALYAWHGRHHVAHITELRKRMGW